MKIKDWIKDNYDLFIIYMCVALFLVFIIFQVKMLIDLQTFVYLSVIIAIISFSMFIGSIIRTLIIKDLHSSIFRWIQVVVVTVAVILIWFMLLRLKYGLEHMII